MDVVIVFYSISMLRFIIIFVFVFLYWLMFGLGLWQRFNDWFNRCELRNGGGLDRLDLRTYRVNYYILRIDRLDLRFT